MVVSEIYIEKEPSTIDITTLGIDLAKSVFSFMALQNGGVHIRPHMTRPIY
jgi:hypothetical protein|tara:strand:+ start:184 stop:336 length:153 start_codon:yes stop_codon:yes gene_type:complete